MKRVHEIPEKYQDHNLTGSVGSPAVIVYPSTPEEVAEVVKEAKENNQSIVTIGAKTGVVSGSLADKNSILLSTEQLNEIIGFDEDTMTLTVEAGVTLNEIREYLEDTPYFYAPDPGSKEATVGGTAATNAGGMKAVKYGVTRDSVKGLEVVLANGEVLTLDGLNKKNASGYDLKDLFIGSEGTLGIVTKLQLAVHPEPQAENSVLMGFNSMEEAAPVIFSILQSAVTPTALEFVDKEAFSFSEEYLGLDMVDIEGTNYLLATTDGPDVDTVKADVARLTKLANEAGALEVKQLSTEEADLMWNLRDAIATAIGNKTEVATYDVVVPITQIAQTLKDMNAIGAEANIHGVYFGHAGDGNIHALMMRDDLDDEAWVKGVAHFDSKLYRQVAENGGLPAAEHGIGMQKINYLEDTLGSVHIEAMKAVKKALDPDNLFNPGKVLAM
jgi:glycolate oxidase